MKKLYIGVCLFLASSAVFATETITLLDRREPFNVLAIDSGMLWVVHNRLGMNSSWRLQTYDMAGKKIQEVRLPHAVDKMENFPGGGVLMTGRNGDNLTSYSIAKIVGGRITMATRLMETGYITFWIGQLGGSHYFADMGGNMDDPGELSQPAQTLFRAVGSQAQYLKARLRAPVDGTVVGNELVVIASAGLGSAAAHVLAVDPKTAKIRPILSTKTGGFATLETLPGSGLLMTNARQEKKVVIFKTDGKIVREYPTEGYTRSLASFGKCMLAGNDETNTVQVFDLNAADTKPVFTAAVGLPAEKFSGLKRIVVNQATGELFGRAADACDPTVDCSKDNNRVIKFSDDVTKQLFEACKR